MSRRSADDFLVVERNYSDDASLPSVGLANIRAVVPGIEENKQRIERACRQFKERGVSVAIFPEFCLSGYFWENEDACWVHNLDIAGARRQEKDDFDYSFDFSAVYRPMSDGRGYTRSIPLSG